MSAPAVRGLRSPDMLAICLASDPTVLGAALRLVLGRWRTTSTDPRRLAGVSRYRWREHQVPIVSAAMALDEVIGEEIA